MLPHIGPSSYIASFTLTAHLDNALQTGMLPKIRLSVVLCTRDRAAALQESLKSWEKVSIPSGLNAELLVVDNGSRDNTSAIVKNASITHSLVRYLYDGRKGKSNALNSALASARGEFILFTDDDVYPAVDWIEQLIAPLMNDTCDAVTGRITLAPHLQKAWMSSMHKWWMASSDDAQPHEGIRELIGANMAFKRSVLRRVPGFDSELGPGALGLTEDTLFGWQLVKAGLRVGYAPTAHATHHPHKSRLWRASWLEEAKKHGRSKAYLTYHWEHSGIWCPRLRQFYYWIKLQVRRLLERPLPMESDGCAPWEISYVANVEMCKQFCVERRRPRNYTRHGLAKRA
jgi:glycosyltransferase involved in cell wall biosynthesis